MMIKIQPIYDGSMVSGVIAARLEGFSFKTIKMAGVAMQDFFFPSLTTLTYATVNPVQ